MPKDGKNAKKPKKADKARKRKKTKQARVETLRSTARRPVTFALAAAVAVIAGITGLWRARR